MKRSRGDAHDAAIDEIENDEELFGCIEVLYPLVVDIAFAVAAMNGWDQLLRFDANDVAFWEAVRANVHERFRKIPLDDFVKWLKDEKSQFVRLPDVSTWSLSQCKAALQTLRGIDHVDTDAFDEHVCRAVCTVLRAPDRDKLIHGLGMRIEALIRHAGAMVKEGEDTKRAYRSILEEEAPLSE